MQYITRRQIRLFDLKSNLKKALKGGFADKANLEKALNGEFADIEAISEFLSHLLKRFGCEARPLVRSDGDLVQISFSYPSEHSGCFQYLEFLRFLGDIIGHQGLEGPMHHDEAQFPVSAEERVTYVQPESWTRSRNPVKPFHRVVYFDSVNEKFRSVSLIESFIAYLEDPAEVHRRFYCKEQKPLDLEAVNSVLEAYQRLSLQDQLKFQEKLSNVELAARK